jgi:cytochrome P450
MAPYHGYAAAGFGSLAGLLGIILTSQFGQTHTVGWYVKIILLSTLEYAAIGLVYRLAFHPLAHYPGPLVGACTDWYTVFWIASGGRHLDLYTQHKKHGKFVRYGPNRVSINSATASLELHDVNANTFKSNVYGVFKRFFGAEMSLTTVDHKLHGFRRRVNVAALKPSIIKGWTGRIKPHVDYFLDVLLQGSATDSASKAEGWSSGKNMTTMVAYCMTDIMGDITFSQTLNVQREEKNRHFVSSIPRGVGGMHMVGHMQWMILFNIHKLLFRELITGVEKFMDLSRLFAIERLKQYKAGVKGNDIWERLLLTRDPETDQPFTQDELVAEASLMITGGTDGMISAMTATLFYLLHNPETLARLTREIRAAFPPKAVGESESPCPIEFASQELLQMTYLTACIDEAMRLSPPVPSILPRRVGPGGITVEGRHFPAGVDLGIPHYCLHRNEAMFPKSSEYHPERWMPGEGMAKTTAKGSEHEHGPLRPGVGQAFSFTPFGAGRSSCIGRHVAYYEMTYVLGRLVWELDMQLDPTNSLGEGTGNGSEGRDKKDEFQIFCCFVSWQDGPVMQFRRRSDLPSPI